MLLARGGSDAAGCLWCNDQAALVPRPVTYRAGAHDFAVVGENFTKVCGTRPPLHQQDLGVSRTHADVVQVVLCEVVVSMPRDELRLALVR